MLRLWTYIKRAFLIYAITKTLKRLGRQVQKALSPLFHSN
jgi:hypothetical protein